MMSENYFLEENSKELNQLMKEKASELFAICDVEQKEFITKRDIQRIREEAQLTPDQLEAVFDTLDVDKNGYLTLEEFTDGFGQFLGLEQPSTPDVDYLEEELHEENVIQERSNTETRLDEEIEFEELLDKLGAHDLFRDEEAVRNIWSSLQHADSNTDMINNFEGFLGKLTQELQNRSADQHHLEGALVSKKETHEEQIERLYEEMERQIKEEKDRIKIEKENNERKVKTEYEERIHLKNQQLLEIQRKYHQLQAKLEKMTIEDIEIRNNSQEIERERKELIDKISHQNILMDELKESLEKTRQKSKEEKKNRVKNVLSVTEGIALERESIVQELEFLREENTKLIDNKDEQKNGSMHNHIGPRNEGENMSAYMENKENRDNERICDIVSLKDEIEFDNSHEFDADDCVSLNFELMKPFNRMRSERSVSLMEELADSAPELSPNHHQHEDVFQSHNASSMSSLGEVENLKRVKDNPSNNYPHSSTLVIYTSSQNHLEGEDTEDLHKCFRDVGNKSAEDQSKFCDLLETRDSYFLNEGNKPPFYNQPSGQTSHSSVEMITMDSLNVSENTDTAFNNNIIAKTKESRGDGDEEEPSPYIPVSQPERVFKVIFIGDSNVGKTSFIHRFCLGKHESNFGATIGVDFRVRSLLALSGRPVVLQLWDTAGQERFRSITRQYFRKADAVVIVYDITNEQSFKNVRSWIAGVRDETANSGMTILLVGNKADLAQDDLCREVRKKDGQQLARAEATLFYEVSALSGLNVEESLQQLSELLVEKQDDELVQSIRLEEQAKLKKKCC